MVDARSGVETVHGEKGPVQGELAEHDPLDPAVEEGHGAHVTWLLVQVHITASAEISRTLTFLKLRGNCMTDSTWTVSGSGEGSSTLEGGDSVDEDDGGVVERVGGVWLGPGDHGPSTVHHQPGPPLLTEGRQLHHLPGVVAGAVQQALQVLVRVEIGRPGITNEMLTEERVSPVVLLLPQSVGGAQQVFDGPGRGLLTGGLG